MKRVYKGRNGWKAEESHELGANLRLSISTFKLETGSVVTTATVAKHEDGFVTHRVFQDFHQRIGLAKFRVTEKAIGEHHDAMIKDAGGIETLIAMAKCHHRAELTPVPA